MENNEEQNNNEEKHECCGSGNCGSGHDHSDQSHEGHDHSAHDHSHEGHDHAPVDPQNPFANLSEDIKRKIQELQMMEQSFQQLMMQKNTFSMEINETEHILAEVEKTSGEVSRIIGNQVVIKSTKEDILEDMKKKKELLETRMKTIDEQEKEFTEKMESVREEVMKEIQA